MSPSQKMTADQAESLEAMRSCLRCHLCNQRFTEPSTLMSCNHSFCQGCILKYTEDNWNCPGEFTDALAQKERDRKRSVPLSHGIDLTLSCPCHFSHLTHPVKGCGLPVSLKGDSGEYIKKNPIISAVSSSFRNIEKILGQMPIVLFIFMHRYIFSITLSKTSFYPCE